MGVIVSIISTALAVYYGTASLKAPDITCDTYPLRTPLVRVGASSSISVHHGTDVIASDLTVARIAIWNKGDSAVRRGHILKPLVIKTRTAVPIVEATIQKQSRDVVNTKLDLSGIATGQVAVTWQIMEENDGCVLQLIYMGDDTVIFEFEGVFEEQKAPSVRSSRKIRKPTDQYEFDRVSALWTGVFFIVIAVFSGIIFFGRRWYRLKCEGVDYVVFLGGCGMALLGIFFIVFLARETGPPFGF
ncbi:MAG TPA: hypothetical protein VMN36_14495 [Verrucomicrobiales bacterium]|nr:hypothetical protein [Verrucomicrobiales bacterium]